MNMEKLTDKQLKFVDEYMIDLNATKAAIRAGYSVKTAQRIGSENLSKPLVANEIDKRKAELSKVAGVTRDEIIADLKAIKDSFKGADKYPPHALKAIEILNKMLGFNEPEKTDITTNGQSLIPPTIKVNIIKPKNE